MRTASGCSGRRPRNQPRASARVSEYVVLNSACIAYAQGLTGRMGLRAANGAADPGGVRRPRPGRGFGPGKLVSR
ncbi:hypothetical protein GCM10023205_11360 [Yinghuangia aomiensis]|uniref:Uncharacterized protein n=1 Tax=Yinghuangia aomiensis TaxID=676205 RepID=A0ABP9GSS6_9ACTN